MNAKLHAKHFKKLNSTTSFNKSNNSSIGLSERRLSSSSERINLVTQNELVDSQHSKSSQNDCKDLSSWSGAIVKPDEKKEDEKEEEMEFHYASEQILGYNMSDDDLASLPSDEILPLAPLNILLVDDSKAILKLTG